MKRWKVTTVLWGFLLGGCLCAAVPLDACDFTGDQKVNLCDFTELSATWLNTLAWYSQSPPQELLAHWRLDQDAMDSHSFFHGEVYGDPVWLKGGQAAVGSGAILMDGQDSIKISGESFPCLIHSFTVDAWIQTAGSAGEDQVIITHRGEWTLGLENGSGNVFLECPGLSGSIRCTGATSLNDNLWHHVAGGYDHSTGQLNIYVDQYLDGQASASGAMNCLSEDLYIGGDPEAAGSECWWYGAIDNVRVYNYALTAPQIFQRKTYHVDAVTGDDNQIGNNAGQGRQNAFQTIQHAIDIAQNGDIVLVWPGVYTEIVDFLGKAITVRSAQQPAVIRAPNDYAVNFWTGEQADSVLENFIIRDSEIGIFVYNSSPTLNHLTIVDNQSGIETWVVSSPALTNSILWYNTVDDLFSEPPYAPHVTYCCVQRGLEGEGNIMLDPLFADPNTGNYHLKSEWGRYSSPDPNQSPQNPGSWTLDFVTSPCVDAGDPKLQPVRESNPNGGRINMGAYGETPYASKSPWPYPADINRNGKVEAEDLYLFTSLWMIQEDE